MREQLRDRLFLDDMLSPEEPASLPRFAFNEPAGSARAAASIAYLIVLIAAIALLLSRVLLGSQLR